MKRLLVAFVIGILLVGIPVQSLAVGNSTNVGVGSVSRNIAGDNLLQDFDVSGSVIAPKGNKTVVKKRPMPSKSKRNETIKVRQFKTKYGGKFSLVDWDEKKKRVKHVYGYYDTGLGNLKTEADAEALARNFLSENSELFKVDMKDIVVSRIKIDKQGVWKIDFAQKYQGIPVYRGEVRVIVSNRSEMSNVIEVR